jgi:hypothetical protein
MKISSLRTFFITWLAWALIVLASQNLATARFAPLFPDMALDWTAKETGNKYQKGHPYLLEPFMNEQVAWDSEYYLAIAVGGYGDQQVSTISVGNQKYALSYAFLPLYPYTIRLFAVPFGWLGLNPIASSTAAGVLVSALGALLGMWALYDLTHSYLGEEGALRAAFYLIIFPTGFFLIQVYTEGLFVGLAFSCLAMLRRRNWLMAALLGAGAALTRAVGVCLVLPMGITWLRSGEWIDLDLEWRQIYFHGIPLYPIGKAILAFAPLLAFLGWKLSFLGLAFDYVESTFFGRGFMNLGMAFYTWSEALRGLFGANPAHTAYYLVEFGGIILGVVASLKCLRTDPELAWFSLAVILISWGSGPAQGMHRYILGAPAVFVMLAKWGQNPVFDKVWTLASLLLMGLMACLFAFNMWVA